MAKASATTGTNGQPIHTRTTGDVEESQAVVLGIDGSDSVVPADATNGLGVDVTRSALPSGAATSAKQDTAQTALDAILTELAQKLEAGGEVALAAATLAALETIELGATTLAALETIELGATTLAALETVDLGSTTLTALETIELGATTLAALETINVKDADGTYGYDAGTSTGTVDVPTGARLKRVSVLAGSGASATVTIGGGDTITVIAGGSFDEQIAGDATGADVVIGGTIQSYYVAWVT